MAMQFYHLNIVHVKIHWSLREPASNYVSLMCTWCVIDVYMLIQIMLILELVQNGDIIQYLQKLQAKVSTNVCQLDIPKMLSDCIDCVVKITYYMYIGTSAHALGAYLMVTTMCPRVKNSCKMYSSLGIHMHTAIMHNYATTTCTFRHFKVLHSQ